MVAFVYRMPSGIPGDVSRKENSVVETQILNASLPFSAYGLVGKMAAGKFVPFAGGEAATDAYGVLVRPFPTNSGTDGLGTATPPASGPGDVLRRGYITVKLNGGATVAAGGQAYIRVAAAAAGKPLGGWEGAADSTNTVAINAIFMSGADADGNVEISFRN
ncbi:MULTISPECIES: structural cement protein Gp24 [Achromobacter]|uniref:structural cement protein Gp24 n=1 Tax=Achromobacter TaxID=222 RepID=UPI0030C7A9BA